LSQSVLLLVQSGKLDIGDSLLGEFVVVGLGLGEVLLGGCCVSLAGGDDGTQVVHVMVLACGGSLSLVQLAVEDVSQYGIVAAGVALGKSSKFGSGLGIIPFEDIGHAEVVFAFLVACSLECSLRGGKVTLAQGDGTLVTVFMRTDMEGY